ARLPQLPALVLDLAKEPRVLDREHRLGCEGLQKRNRFFGKAARLLAPDHERPHDAIRADQRHDAAGSKPGPHRDLPDRARRLVTDIRDLQRLSIVQSDDISLEANPGPAGQYGG